MPPDETTKILLELKEGMGKVKGMLEGIQEDLRNKGDNLNRLWQRGDLQARDINKAKGGLAVLGILIAGMGAAIAFVGGLFK